MDWSLFFAMFRSNAFFLFRIILLHSLSVFAYTILSFLRPVLLHSLPALRFAAIFLRTSVSSHFGSSVRFIFLKGTCKVTAFSSDSLSSAHISFVFCPAMTLNQFLWMALRIPSVRLLEIRAHFCARRPLNIDHS